ncbi:MAG: hypothetical protein ACI8RZ_001134, partial [Myxococcota bacterium]
TLGMHYGAASSADSNYASRVTMLLDGNGDLILEYTDSIEFGTHPEEVYQDCLSIFGE